MAWSHWISDSEANRRAGGRRRYNASRTAAAWERRLKLFELYAIPILKCEHGVKAEAARALGVSKATITRDTRAIIRYGNWERVRRELRRVFAEMARGDK